ncbi:MAG: ATP-grasp domain-containing protein [Candidatus Woesearchaeota archaeon]|nr:ATP-grasp domain-containing protein [Candidatus Woesearchaeota archaeon]
MNREKNKKLTIALTYNKKRSPKEGELEDLYAEFDTDQTINAVKNAIESKGSDVILIEADEDAFLKLKALKNKIDLVFNIAEGIRGDARESHIPAFCEMLNIPHTASSALTLAITLDKARTKEILSYSNIATPKFQVFNNENEKLNADLNFPLIVKPLREGSSKGIRNNNIVASEKELRSKIKELIENYRQPAIAEEFIEGREFTAAVIENGSQKVLPLVEITFDYLPKHIKKIDSYEVKWIYDNPNSKIDPLVCPAKLDKETEDKIKKISLDAFNALGCKDWCRIDIRLDKKGIPKVLEVNALPGIMPDPKENSRLPKAAYAAGMSYDQLINIIVDNAIERHNI